MSTKNLEFVLQQMHTALTPTRGRTRWRHGEGCRSDMIPRLEDESGICFRNDHFPWKVLYVGSPSRSRMMGILRVAL